MEGRVPIGARLFSSDGAILAASWNGTGERSRARPLYRRALSIYEEALGAEHPHVALVVENLAGLALMAGLYEEAEPLFARALAIKERRYGWESPDLIDTLQNYALVLAYLGREKDAELLDTRAAAIRERLNGSGTP